MNYLKYLVEEMHTVIVATVDNNNQPVTSAIDIMDYDNNGLYFLTAKGKGFYDRLIKNKFISLTAIKGNSTMESVALSVRGKVKELGYDLIDDLFAKNTYMNEIYPTEQAKKALTVFYIYDGNGEWFDLSKKPIERESFSFGNEEYNSCCYCITESCMNCGACVEVCPQGCIDITKEPAEINQKNCLHCGNCYDICPVDAVSKRG